MSGRLPSVITKRPGWGKKTAEKSSVAQSDFLIPIKRTVKKKKKKRSVEGGGLPLKSYYRFSTIYLFIILPHRSCAFSSAFGTNRAPSRRRAGKSRARRAGEPFRPGVQSSRLPQTTSQTDFREGRPDTGHGFLALPAGGIWGGGGEGRGTRRGAEGAGKARSQVRASRRASFRPPVGAFPASRAPHSPD